MSVFEHDSVRILRSFDPVVVFSVSDTPLPVLLFTTSVQGPDFAIDGEAEPGEQLQEVQLGGDSSLLGGKLPITPRTTYCLYCTQVKGETQTRDTYETHSTRA